MVRMLSKRSMMKFWRLSPRVLLTKNIYFSLQPSHLERTESRLILEAEQGQAWVVVIWENMYFSLSLS